MRAEIDIGNSAHPALLIRLKQKKALVNRWARRWRAPIRAIATPHGSAVGAPEEGVTVFKPYATTPMASTSQKQIAKIFGYPLPEFEDARTRLAPSASARQFLSPEMNRVAQANPGTFSFLVNVLGYDWEGAEEVLDILFACSLPMALPELHVRKRARRLKSVLKRKLRRDRAKIEAAYLPLIKDQTSGFIARHERGIAEITASMAEKERERIALLSEIAEIEEYLAHAEALAKSADDIEREFEQILRMEGVAVIRIEKEYSGEGQIPILVITTGRIFQEFNGERYDIGSFQIRINPSKLGRESVRFIEDARGNWVHPHALPDPAASNLQIFLVCFGNDYTTGLNDPVGKLMADFNLVPLMHLLLTFLRLDSMKPREGKFPRTEDVPARLAYASPEDRAKERAAFVELVREVSVRVATSKSRTRLSELERKEDDTTTSYYTARRERNELRERVKLLRNRLATLPDSAKNALRRLIANPNVLSLRVMPRSGGLQVWFWNGRAASIHMIWLDPERSPWIIGYEKLDSVSVYHGLDGGDEKFKRRVLRAIASGKFAQAAELLVGRCSAIHPARKEGE